MTEPNDFNAKIIDEFRANGGKAGMFPNGNLLLLHSTGAKTGAERVSPLGYQKVGDGYAIFGSKAGAPVNPAWYHNLLANPQARTRQKQVAPQFAQYEQKTERQIPVLILDPVG